MSRCKKILEEGKNNIYVNINAADFKKRFKTF